MKLLIQFLLVVQLTQAVAQTNPAVKKAIHTFDLGNYNKGIVEMEKIVENESSTDNWDILINLYYRRYKYANAPESVETENKRTEYFNELIYKCKTATLYSQSPLASQLLRNYFIDVHPNDSIAEDAKKEYHLAEKFFKAKDYSNTKLYYLKALKIQPNYYKATIYLGDTYWYLNKIDSAIFYFKKGIAMQPTFLEPHIYLLEALISNKKNAEVKNEFDNTLCIYPDITMFTTFANYNKKQGIKFDRHWIKRGSEINVMGDTPKKPDNAVWLSYQTAKDDIKEFCDSDGIIQNSNAFTNSKYLEVYSWEKMLNNANQLPEEFAFAKKMYDSGYLDCYVFISAFHFDFYEQYKDFVLNNKDKIKKYVETYLMEK